MAECALDTPAIDKLEQHHELVKKAVELAETEAAKTGGQLGNQSSARKWPVGWAPSSRCPVLHRCAITDWL